jgi:type II secretory pathway pseudopilin PulG
MKINFNTEKCFTMVEILVYISVLSIVVITIISFLIWSTQSNTKLRVMREVLDNTKRAMEIMTYEIREAKSIYTPTTIFDTNLGQLSLETKKYLPTEEETSFIDFYLCGTRLCLKKESQNPIPLTSDKVEVKDLIFSQITTGNNVSAIQINLKIDYKNPNNRSEYSASVNVTSAASLRVY